MATILVSYAAGAPVHAANQRALVESARRMGGFDRIETRGALSSAHPLRSRHPDILSAAEGAGYWLWKPQVILEALESSAPGDVVIYIDAGARLRSRLSPLLSLARSHDAVLIANDYLAVTHTKRDAFILTGTDHPGGHASRQLDAAFMAWRNTEGSQRLVRNWLRACEDPRALSDVPSVLGAELPSFRAHRHDQALLSLLVHRDRSLYRLAILPRDVKYRFIEHHRRRVSWMPVALWHATHDLLWERQRARKRRQRVLERRRLRARQRPGKTGEHCAMLRLADLRLYSSVDHGLAFLRALPQPAPAAGPPLPVHFYWDGPVFAAKPALCLQSFLVTQDPARFRPWLWLADEGVWEKRTQNPFLAPLLPYVQTRRFDLEATAPGTPLEEAALKKTPGAAASDLARLLCLFHHGGCYSDLDVVFLRDLGPLLELAADREFCFQWSGLPFGTNAFSRHHQGSPVLVDLMKRAVSSGNGHPRHLLAFDAAPSQMLLMPVTAFSPAWLVHDGLDRSAFSPLTRFPEFFAPLAEDDRRRATLDNFFPGAFTYHWHGQWNAPELSHSWVGQLAEDIRSRLAKTHPGLALPSLFSGIPL